MVPHAMIHVRAVNNSAVDDGAVSALNDGALHTARGGSAAAVAAPAAPKTLPLSVRAAGRHVPSTTTTTA